MAFWGFAKVAKRGYFGGPKNIKNGCFWGRFWGSNLGTLKFLCTLPLFGSLELEMTFLAYFRVCWGQKRGKNGVFGTLEHIVGWRDIVGGIFGVFPGIPIQVISSCS
jgi:hypothetical protein